MVQSTSPDLYLDDEAPGTIWQWDEVHNLFACSKGSLLHSPVSLQCTQRVSCNPLKKTSHTCFLAKPDFLMWNKWVWTGLGKEASHANSVF